jgi:hypothetical protein
MKTVIEMAREAGFSLYRGISAADGSFAHLERFAELVRADERERICKAIKTEDDYCVDEGDYMLDSDDCIAVAKGEWVRPDYNVDAIRARSNT